MQFTKKQKVAAVLGAGAVAVAGGGVAFAYWTSTGGGTGTGSTTAGNATAFTVAGDDASAMYPGDSAQTVTATVTNSSTTESYKLQSLKAYLTVVKDASNTATGTCDSSDYLLNGVAAPGTSATAADLSVTPIELAAGGTTTKTFTLQFNDKATNQDQCKGAAVTINYIAG